MGNLYTKKFYTESALQITVYEPHTLLFIYSISSERNGTSVLFFAS